MNRLRAGASIEINYYLIHNIPLWNIRTIFCTCQNILCNGYSQVHSLYMSNIPYTKSQNAFNLQQQDIVMGNRKENDSGMLIGKTIRDVDDNSTTLIIPSEFDKEMDIENSKLLISLLYGFDGNKHLIVSKFHKEIVIDQFLV